MKRVVPIFVFFLLEPLQAKVDHPLILTLREKLKDVSTLSADIEQVRRLSVFKDELRAKGRLLFKKPNKLRWQIDSPYETALVYSNGKVAKFEKRAQTWTKLNFGGADIMASIMQKIVYWQQGKFNDDNEFDLKIIEQTITLKPKSSRLAKGIKSIALKVDEKSFFITKVTINEPGGDHVEISFRNIKPNIHIKSEDFNVN